MIGWGRAENEDKKEFKKLSGPPKKVQASEIRHQGHNQNRLRKFGEFLP